MVYIVGDIYINHKVHELELQNSDTLVICGDFSSVWNGDETNTCGLTWLESLPCTVLFLGGRDERLSSFLSEPEVKKFGGRLRQVRDNVYYVPSFTVLEIEFRSYLFIGGGFYGDRISDDERARMAIVARHSEHRYGCVISYLAPAGVLERCEPQWVDGFPKAVAPPEIEETLSWQLRQLAEQITYGKWYCSSAHIDAYSDELKVYGVAQEVRGEEVWYDRLDMEDFYDEFDDEHIFDDVRKICADRRKETGEEEARPSGYFTTYNRRKRKREEMSDFLFNAKELLFCKMSFLTYIIVSLIALTATFWLLRLDFWNELGVIGECITWVNMKRQFATGVIWTRMLQIGGVLAIEALLHSRRNLMFALESCLIAVMVVACIGMYGLGLEWVAISYYVAVCTCGVVCVQWCVSDDGIEGERWYRAFFRRMRHIHFCILPIIISVGLIYMS